MEVVVEDDAMNSARIGDGMLKYWAFSYGPIFDFRNS
jgi:hypothetical protein